MKSMELGDKLLDFVSPVVLWITFIFVILFFAALSTVLLYHWRNYNIDNKKEKAIKKLYFSVSALFIFIMFLSAVAYTS